MVSKETVHSGRLYDPTDPELMEEQRGYLERLWEFNHTRPSQLAEREAFMKEQFAECGENCYIEPPFYANWGGKNLHFGNVVYCNFGCKFVDDTHIYIGDYTKLGPGVVLATGGHPILPELREKSLQYNFPVRIGRCCWLGAGVIVVPGVTIGDNCVIGAGSVVIRDVPAGSVAAGNPCRVIRAIGERDREFYFKDLKIDWSRIGL
ncbi:MAG: sugar O-acetyltransferase [Abditibacteriota bacterium]|nr:sugar O-acetyltransferase [Abditibacteriota bacterium]